MRIRSIFRARKAWSSLRLSWCWHLCQTSTGLVLHVILCVSGVKERERSLSFEQRVCVCVAVRACVPCTLRNWLLELLYTSHTPGLTDGFDKGWQTMSWKEEKERACRVTRTFRLHHWTTAGYWPNQPPSLSRIVTWLSSIALPRCHVYSVRCFFSEQQPKRTQTIEIQGQCCLC